VSSRDRGSVCIALLLSAGVCRIPGPAGDRPAREDGPRRLSPGWAARARKGARVRLPGTRSGRCRPVRPWPTRRCLRGSRQAIRAPGVRSWR